MGIHQDASEPSKLEEVRCDGSLRSEGGSAAELAEIVCKWTGHAFTALRALPIRPIGTHVSQLRCTTLPLLAALFLMGQGPLCELLCAPAALESSMSAAHHEAAPPCHGAAPDRTPVESRAPEPSDPDCSTCVQSAASGASVAKGTGTFFAFQPPATAFAWLAAPPTGSTGLARLDDRAPPLGSRGILLRKSSLLL